MEYKNYLPLTDIDQDKLNFKELSIEIADFINSFPSDVPFSISLNGSWGSGKSTMLNFIETNLNEKCKVIRFNPWLITNKEDLILSIFEELNEQIASKYSKIKEKLKSYSLKFMPTFVKGLTYYESMRHNIDPSLTGVIAGEASNLAESFFKEFDKPLSVQKTELEKELKEVLFRKNEKLVIFIDELDRLFPDEIITVFQMIKAILDFPGVLFVVAMDEEVVKNALAKKGIQRPTDYLDKIFQKNYSLVSKYQIKTLTYNYIYTRLDRDNRCHRLLKICLDAYIMGENDLQITSINHDINLILENCETEEDTMKQWKLTPGSLGVDTLIRSYQNLFREFSSSLNLDNPRRFSKFANYLFENWPKLYEQLFKEGTTDSNLYCAFLLLVTNYFYPEYISVTIFDSKYRVSDPAFHNVPMFVKTVKEHLDLIFPVYYSGDDTLKTTKFIRECCNKIISYPDMNLHFNERR
ncbi:P-loop NTPase fold protein [Bacillus haynesii]|uniref:KAP family P-loop NTPase fold protein n=1 Tax=Bacillus haynesii TaxID=1925021 RepID=UPI002DBF4217|nr:P-loop NTPase fold protein [Bacillus haynesii]MEC1551579.1 P-loop NTPase fold protein [Bacillus haynesii]